MPGFIGGFVVVLIMMGTASIAFTVLFAVVLSGAQNIRTRVSH